MRIASFINLAQHLSTAHAFEIYVLIFIGMIIEGDLVLIFTGVAVHLKLITFPMAVMVALAGTIVKALIGYWAGRQLRISHGHREWVQKIDKKVHETLPKISEKPFVSLLASKFLYGVFLVSYFALMFLGYKNIGLEKALKADTLASLIWIVLLIIVGITSSATALKFAHNISQFGEVLLVFLFGFFAVQFIYRKFFRKI